MELKKFAIGIRFAYMGEQSEADFARKMYEEIFSVLTLSDLEGLYFYGGSDPLSKEVSSQESHDIFLAVIMGGKLKQMQKVFEAIDNDAALNMYLTHTMPYIENNRLSRIEGLSYYGQVQKDGTVSGGDGTLNGITIPKKRGRRSPVGKGIKILLAPEGYNNGPSAVDAIKLMTVAARKHFQGVKIVPFPVNSGTAGFAKALMTATEASNRHSMVMGVNGINRVKAEYGVLRGKLAVIDTAAEGYSTGAKTEETVTSQGIGELIRRAIDEGLREILIGVSSNLGDCGFGLSKALGVKFFDKDGNELNGDKADIEKIDKADVEYLHPMLKKTKITVFVDPAAKNMDLPEEALPLKNAINNVVDQCADVSFGVAGIIAAVTGGVVTTDFNAVLDAVGFDKLLKGVALVVTGSDTVDGKHMVSGNAVFEIIARCNSRRIPVAVVAKDAQEEDIQKYLGSSCLIRFDAGDDLNESLQSYYNAADRMFRFIRIGRDVEKIGAPPKHRTKTFYKLMREKIRTRNELRRAANV